MQHFSLRSSPARGAFSQRITHSYPIIVSLRVAHFQPSSYRVIARNLTTLSNCTKFLLPGSFLPRQNYRIPSSSNSRLVLFHFYAEKRSIYCVYSLIKQLSSPLITGIVERKRRRLVPLHYYLTHVPHHPSARLSRILVNYSASVREDGCPLTYGYWWGTFHQREPSCWRLTHVVCIKWPAWTSSARCRHLLNYNQSYGLVNHSNINFVHACLLYSPFFLLLFFFSYRFSFFKRFLLKIIILQSVRVDG